MSSIAATFVTDGSTLDRRRLRQLVQPSAVDDGSREAVWHDLQFGVAALGLRPAETPLQAVGRVIVAFDGCLTARASLIASLREGTGVDLSEAASDAQLVGHAYTCWDTDCAERLHGEFAWIVVDPMRARLVACRDRLGVKPLFHTLSNGAVWVGNQLSPIQRLPNVSTSWSDEWMGDFLLFGHAKQLDATIFAGVARVPPAHLVVWDRAGGQRSRQFWHLQPPATRTFKDSTDHATQFTSVLADAVRDRLDTETTAILMSGGLDSSSVAALAAGEVGSARCKAVTAVYDWSMPDRERDFSSLVADALSISIEHVPVDEYDLFERWDRDVALPEPSREPLTAITTDLLVRVGAHSSVALTGDGGDPSLLPGAIVRHLGRVPSAALCRGVWRSVRAGLYPPMGVQTALRQRVSRPPAVPPWLSSRLVRQYDPVSRWAADTAPLPVRDHPRAEALAAIRHSYWPVFFEGYHPGVTGRQVDVRFPFFDERVIECALALPSYPWCLDKRVLRQGMVGRLPDLILGRPKAPLAGDALAIRRWPVARVVSSVAGVEGLADYVDVEAFRVAVERAGPAWTDMPGVTGVIGLALWLKRWRGNGTA